MSAKPLEERFLEENCLFFNFSVSHSSMASYKSHAFWTLQEFAGTPHGYAFWILQEFAGTIQELSVILHLIDYGYQYKLDHNS